MQRQATLKYTARMLATKRPSGPDTKRLIRLYINRRLYDTSAHSYITHRDLQHLVRKGVDFVIVEDKKGVDHTDRILLEMMLDRAAAPASSDGNVVLSDGFLRELIAVAAKAPIAVIRTFLDESMGYLALAQRGEANLPEGLRTCVDGDASRVPD